MVLNKIGRTVGPDEESVAKQGTYEERVHREGGSQRSRRGREVQDGRINGSGVWSVCACACARVYVRARACESAQARSPKWNSMTELEREKGNSCGKGEGNEMAVWRRRRKRGERDQ